jgi:hypothetical protein
VAALPIVTDGASSAQGKIARVVGEDDTVGAEPVDQGCRIGRAGHLYETEVPAARFPGRAREQESESGQVRQNLVLAHARGLRPAGVRAGGTGVAVAAPVGGLPVGPRRLQAPPAPPACQEPGQQVPACAAGPAGPRGAAMSWP